MRCHGSTLRTAGPLGEASHRDARRVERAVDQLRGEGLVRGRTVAELGPMNQPFGIVSYEPSTTRQRSGCAPPPDYATRAAAPRVTRNTSGVVIASTMTPMASTTTVSGTRVKV